MRTAEEYVEQAEFYIAKGGDYAATAQVFATLAIVAHAVESDNDFDEKAAAAEELAEQDRTIAEQDRAAQQDLLRLARQRLEEEESYRKTLG